MYMLFFLRSILKAERQAVNSIIQGSAAEVAKKAMLQVDEAIYLANLQDNIRLVLHEHDELIYEVNLLINFLI